MRVGGQTRVRVWTIVNPLEVVGKDYQIAFCMFVYQKSKEPVPVSTQPSVLTSIDPDAAIRGLTSLSTELTPASTKQRHGKKGSDHAQMSSDAHPKVSVIISTSRGDPNLPGINREYYQASR